MSLALTKISHNTELKKYFIHVLYYFFYLYMNN
jgi:hypothetical protein